MANVYRYFPTQAISFAVKEQLTKRYLQFDPKKEPAKFFCGSIIAGGVAGVVSQMFVYPLDFARTRLGVDLGKERSQREFQNLTDCCLKIYKKEGIRGLYRGFPISGLSCFIYRGLFYGGYDVSKKYLLKPNSSLVTKS